MKIWILAALAGAAILGGAAMAEERKGVAVGAEVPDFRLNDHEGKAVRLSEFKGKAWRIGVMGLGAELSAQARLVSALATELGEDAGEALAALGATAPNGSPTTGGDADFDVEPAAGGHPPP